MRLQPDAEIEALGMRREPLRILSAVDLAFLAWLAVVLAAHAVAGIRLPAEWPIAAMHTGGPLLALSTAACAAWLLVRLPTWRSRLKDRW